MPYDARAIANALLDYSVKQSRPVSHLALQKILYFCHGWYLAKYQEPLINERVEAWGHGPVFKSAYKAFKECGRENIEIRAVKMDFDLGSKIEVRDSISTNDLRFVQNIFDAYSRFSAIELRRISHAKNGAWYGIWNASREKAVAGMKIPNDLIYKCFLEDEWPSGH